MGLGAAAADRQPELLGGHGVRLGPTPLVECVSVEGRARLADPDRDGAGIDAMVAAYVTKYWDDPAVHADMEAFLRSHTIIEMTPERAFGIIEREAEFAERATRWRF